MLQHKVMGVFSYLDDVLAALSAAKRLQCTVNTVFSPVPHHEIQQALDMKKSPVGYATLFGGIAGIISGVSLAVYAHLSFRLITSGKPILAWIPFCVVAFEFCILIGFLTTLVTMLIANRMPRFRMPQHYDQRFSQDRYGVLVSCPAGKREKIIMLLKEAGAEEVHEISG
jgi:uncharacterized membrane protein